MNAKQNKFPILNKWISVFKDIFSIFLNEFKIVFKDRGVVIIFILASLVYPMLYCGLYKNETLVNVPIAAVDYSHSKLSGELIRHLDATSDVKVYRFGTLNDAKKAFDERKVHGLVFIPADFNKRLTAGDQATVSVYCDMSSFLYYRSLTLASTYSILDMSNKIQVERLNEQGITGQNATITASPIPFESNILFNEGMGFASFLMPAILMLIIHQTLFFGIGMLAGTSREENRFHELVSSKLHRGGTLRVVIGKAACYMLMYMVFSFYIIELTPHVFNLPHIGNSIDLVKFMFPFLLSTIFFSMTVSVFLPNRETGMIIFLFFSLILLFLSGISWPKSNINGFWKAFAWIFPATHGIQGYIKINTFGADVHHITYEYVSLWIQTGLYFMTTYLTYRWQIKRSSNKLALKSEPVLS
jgi:ABC-2 type transport system permease protein